MMRELIGAIDEVDSMLNQSPQVSYKQNQPMDKVKNGSSKYFRNPPQPHMCIQDYIVGCRDPCYINVLSWVKISIPRKPDDPIPLYGGMRVPQNTTPSLDKKRLPPRRTPIIFAVMANPEILRLNGKMASDPSDRAALVDLMLDFVEAMNPDVRFSRNFQVLEDRDLTGELKDIWTAIQLKREREKDSGKYSGRYRKSVNTLSSAIYSRQTERLEDSCGYSATSKRIIKENNDGQGPVLNFSTTKPLISIQSEILASSSDSSEEDDRSESTSVEDSELPNGDNASDGRNSDVKVCGSYENNSNDKCLVKVNNDEYSEQISNKSQIIQDENIADNAQDLNNITAPRATNQTTGGLNVYKNGPCRLSAWPARATPCNHKRGLAEDGNRHQKSEIKDSEMLYKHSGHDRKNVLAQS